MNQRCVTSDTRKLLILAAHLLSLNQAKIGLTWPVKGQSSQTLGCPSSPAMVQDSNFTLHRIAGPSIIALPQWALMVKILARVSIK
jgi:hypothetical protein